MRRSALVPAIAAATLLLLAGCAPHPAASSTPTSVTTSTPTPSTTPTPTAAALPADVLFQITVIATAPDGAKAQLTEIVHAPVTSTTTQAADESELDNECDSWRNAFSPMEFLTADVTATTLSGTWTLDGAVAADMAGYPVWTGDQQPFQAYCASALPSIPGSARAVSPVGGAGADTNGGWGIYRYGFAVPTDPSTSQSTAAPDDVVLSQCGIQLGAAAKDSAFASTWPTSAQTDGGLSCLFGGT